MILLFVLGLSVFAGTTAAIDSPQCDVTVSPGDSIQDAITDPDVGDTVCLENGTYEQSVVLDKQVSLKSVPGASPVLEPGDADGTGISISASEASVVGITVQNFPGHGIRVDGATDVTVDDVTATNNGGVGILFENARDGTVTGSTVTGNGFELDEDAPGIRFFDSPDGEISENHASDNARQGINVWNLSAGTSVESNTVTGNEMSGIYIQDANSVTIEDNTAEDNGFRGIHVQGSDEFVDEQRVLTGIEVRGNKISNNSQSTAGDAPYTGIFVQSVNGALVTDNTLEQTLRGAIIAEETIDVEIRENDISDPRSQTSHVLQAIDSQNVVIQDNTLTDVGQGILVSEDGFDTFGDKPFDASNAEIRGNDITNVENGPAIQLGFSPGPSETYNGSANALIEGNVIEDTSSASILLVGLSSGTVIENNDVTNAGPSGIEVQRGGGFDLTDPDLTFLDTTDVTVTNNRLNESNAGVRLEATTRATVEDNVLARNDVGISSTLNQTDTVIRHNEIIDSTDAGIRFTKAAGDLHAYGNHIEGGDGNGIQVGSAGGGTFENNTITDVGRFGVMFYDNFWQGTGTPRSTGGAFSDQRNEALLIDNEISNAGVDGVRVDFGTGIEIRDNEITDSAEHGVRLAYRSSTVDGIAEDFFRAAEDTTVSGNEIIGSGEIGLYVDTIANPITPGGSGGGGSSDPDPENEFPSGVFVTDNQFESNGDGTVFTPYVSEIEIENNTYVDHNTDLVLDRVSDVELFDNTFEAGILVDGEELEHFAHGADNNVFEDDSPLFYATGESGTEAPSDARQVFVVGSTDVTVNAIESEGVPIGLLVFESDDVSVTDMSVTEAGSGGDRGIAVLGETTIDISGTTVTGYNTGIWFEGVENATFTDGEIVDTTGEGDGAGGIVAADSTNVTIAMSDLSGHASHAIRFDEVEVGTIESNEVNSSERGIWVRNSGAVDISHNDVQETTERGINAFSAGIPPEFETATVIDSNRVTDGDDVGISGSDAEAVTNNTVRNNERTGINADGVIADNHVENNGNGIVGSSNIDSIRNNTILQSHGNDRFTEGDGIQITSATTVDIENNEIKNNDRFGIYTRNADIVTILNNTVADNADHGIEIETVADVIVEDNSIRGHDDGGILNDAAGLRVDADGLITIGSNTIEDNTDGLRIESVGDEGVGVTGNQILANTRGVYVGPNANQITITGNDIDGNSGFGLRYDGGTSTLDATDNWWGAESGPSTTGSDGPFVDAGTGAEADGDGDAIQVDSGPIQFTPVATAPQSGAEDPGDGDVPEEDGTITGVITADGEPVSGASVSVAGTSTETNADGEYAIDVAPGTYTVTITTSDPALDSESVSNVEVSSDSVTTVSVELEPIPLGTIEGTVTAVDSGEPVPGALVRVIGESSKSVTTNETGEYAVDVAPGTYEVSVSVEGLGLEPTTVSDVEVADGETKTVDVALEPVPEPATITGTVTDGDEDPITGVPIQVIDAETGEIVSSPSESVDTVMQTDRDDRELIDLGSVTNETGEYAIDVPPGTYEVSIFTEELIAAPITVTVDEGEAVEDVDLTAEPIPDPDEVEFTVDILGNESTVDVQDGEEITVVAEITNDGDVTAAVITVMAAGVIDGDELPTDVDPLDVDFRESPLVLAPEDTITETFAVASKPEFDGADAVVAVSEIKNNTIVGSDTISLSVSEQPATLESVTLDAAETTLTEGSTTPVTVTATFDDDSTEDVTGDAAFDSSDTRVVSVDGSALTAESSGTATVTATYEGETDSVEVTVEADDQPRPEVAVTNVIGNGEDTDPVTGMPRVYASEDVSVELEVVSDVELEDVAVSVSSLETTYTRTFEATHQGGDAWTATVTLAAIEDDGRYEIVADTTDTNGAVTTGDADEVLLIDRETPAVSTTLQNASGNGPSLLVESDTPLANVPEIDADVEALLGDFVGGSVELDIGGEQVQPGDTRIFVQPGDTRFFVQPGDTRDDDENGDTSVQPGDTRIFAENDKLKITSEDDGTPVAVHPGDTRDGDDEQVQPGDMRLFVQPGDTRIFVQPGDTRLDDNGDTSVQPGDTRIFAENDELNIAGGDDETSVQPGDTRIFVDEGGKLNVGDENGVTSVQPGDTRIFVNEGGDIEITDGENTVQPGDTRIFVQPGDTRIFIDDGELKVSREIDETAVQPGDTRIGTSQGDRLFVQPGDTRLEDNDETAVQPGDTRIFVDEGGELAVSGGNGATSVQPGDTRIFVQPGDTRLEDNGATSVQPGDTRIFVQPGDTRLEDNGATSVQPGDTRIFVQPGDTRLEDNGATSVQPGDTRIFVQPGDTRLEDNGATSVQPGDTRIFVQPGDTRLAVQPDKPRTYALRNVGTDLAGNDVVDETSISLNPGFTLNDPVLEVGDSSTKVEFTGAAGADKDKERFTSLSETRANANLEDDQLGVGFLTGTFDGELNDIDASIMMAIDESELPDGASAGDVELQYYDDASESWTTDPIIDSTTGLDGNDPFLSASVTGFSTYGAFVPDTDAPRITDASPSDGSTLDADTEETTVRFEYEDDRSGVDVGSVTLEIDGEDVTGHEETSITSSSAEHVMPVEPGESYGATVTVADTAGNVETAETGFTVETAQEADDGSSSSSGSSGSGSGSGSSGSAADDEEPTEEDVEEATDDEEPTEEDVEEATPDEEPTTEEDVEEPTSDDAEESTETETAPDEPLEEEVGTDDSIPGFGPAVAFVAIVSLLLVASIAARSRR
ncbi:parallel beta-helix repeat (two copies) [Halorubrum vacuolatum]|uniref:Parallel beta-helix repeat (Two copies) n=1 Tax=Halorubrum vacuolatum TaxID=63740 RepID=A0A238VKJ3_HALVU|nr:parallel beta-helix repeat (two copies) [Halorubrum vacuolatum]